MTDSCCNRWTACSPKKVEPKCDDDADMMGMRIMMIGIIVMMVLTDNDDADDGDDDEIGR